MAATVDQVDILLIRCLQDDPRASYATLARITNISESTVRRRVELLIATRAITMTMVPNFERLGYQATAFVGLSTELGAVRDVAKRLQSFPEVTFVTLTMGRFDIVIFVVQRDLQALSNFVLTQVAGIPGVLRSETIVAPTVVKAIEDWKLPDQDTIRPGPADSGRATS